MHHNYPTSRLSCPTTYILKINYKFISLYNIAYKIVIRLLLTRLIVVGGAPIE